MSYQGQPVPSTGYAVGRTKIGDSKSIEVAVPENTTVEAGKFYVLDGFFGAAMQSVTTGADQTSRIILNIEQAEHETDQVETADTFAVGSVVYWNGTKLTSDEDDGGADPTVYRPVGRITSAKDSNNVIAFSLFPQTGFAVTQAQYDSIISRLTALENA